MFKLPQDSNQYKMLTSFSTFVRQKTRTSSKSSNFRTLQRPKTSQGIYHTIQNAQTPLSIFENKQQPERRLVPRSIIRRRQNISKNQLSRYKFIDQILISPSNKKIKYNASRTNVSQMQSNIMKINFLIQPCKVQVMPISARNQIKKAPYLIRQKQKCVHSQRERPNSGLKKYFSNPTRKTASTIKDLQVKKKQQIFQPWEIGDYNYESIRLGKNYF